MKRCLGQALSLRLLKRTDNVACVASCTTLLSSTIAPHATYMLSLGATVQTEKLQKQVRSLENGCIVTHTPFRSTNKTVSGRPFVDIRVRRWSCHSTSITVATHIFTFDTATTMYALKAILGFAALAYATSRTSAPSGALTVGSGYKYSTIQEAVNALSTTSTSAQSIFIGSGTYNEQVYIQALKGELTIYGYTADTSSYADNKVTITSNKALTEESTDDETATLRVETTNFKMYNVNVKNTYGSGSQALALSANAGVRNSNLFHYECADSRAEPRLLWLRLLRLPGHDPG